MITVLIVEENQIDETGNLVNSIFIKQIFLFKIKLFTLQVEQDNQRAEQEKIGFLKK